MAHKILIIEDDRDYADYLQALLDRDKRFETELCYSGRVAVDVFNEFKPDLIITDVVLPCIDGYSLMKETAAKTSTPVIVISASEASKTLFKGFETLVGFLLKPVNYDDLVDLVNRGLQHLFVE